MLFELHVLVCAGCSSVFLVPGGGGERTKWSDRRETVYRRSGAPRNSSGSLHNEACWLQRGPRLGLNPSPPESPSTAAAWYLLHHHSFPSFSSSVRPYSPPPSSFSCASDQSFPASTPFARPLRQKAADRITCGPLSMRLINY